MDVSSPLFRNLRLRCLALALTGLAMAPAAHADVVTNQAASWLIGQQITTGPTTGAFPWTPGQSATQNTQGASALGLLRAWERTGNAAALSAAIANGNCQITNCVPGMTYGDGHHRFASHDALFLEQLTLDSGNSAYAAFVDTELWSRLSLGIYGATANLNAAGYANSVLASRTGQNIPELAAWDLSKTAIAAHLAGETVARDAIMQAVLASLNASDAAHSNYDVVGLTGAIWASAVTGINLDPTTGKWASANSTAQLANLLLAWQAPGGGIVGSTAAAGGAIDSNADTQTTSFAMQALDALNASAYAAEINDGFSFITGLQEPSGEFLGYIGAAPGSQGAVEGHGETLEAYASITQRPSIVYVDDNFFGDVPGEAENFSHPQVNGGVAIPVIYGVDAFASISAALAKVKVGGTVYVAKGLYAESNGNGGNLVISQAVSVIGEKAGIDARTRNNANADETVVIPAIAQVGLGYGSSQTSVIDIAGGNIVLDGLVVDGDNPSLDSGLAYNGANPDVAGGIYAQGKDNHLRNLVIRNILYAGINGYAVGNAVGGNIISHNRFANITRPSTSGRGIILQENFYAQVTQNLFGEVRVGVQTNNNYRAAPNGFAPSITGNEINAARTGIFHNLFYQDATTYTIADNQFKAVANAAETGEWSGLWIESMGGAQTTVVSNNSVNGSAVVASRASVGYLLNNLTSSAASSVINGGSVTGVGAGVQSTDATFYTGPVNDIIVRNVAFSDISVGAFYVEDTTQQAGTAKLTIGAGNTYSNVANVLALSGTAPDVAFADGVTGVASTFVRSARNYYNNPASPAYSVANASINTGIGFTNASGTVSVEAGTFSVSGLVNKSVNVKGAFAGINGFDPLRNGTGESIVAPGAGPAFTLAASGAVVDGFTMTVASGSAVGNSGPNRDNMQLINNRVINIPNGVGIQFEPGEGTPASGLAITGNLFANIGGTGLNGTAIQLYKGTRNAVVSNNHIDSAKTYAIQVNGGSGSVLNTTITGNVISDSLAVATSNAFIATNVTGMQIRGNTVSGVATGLFLSDKDSTVDFTCNSISGANRGISMSAFFGGLPNTGIRILDNAIVGSVTADINNGLVQDLVVGSNWYGGGNAVVTGSNAYVADGLPVNPIGNPACGANNPTAIVAYAGSGQSTLVNTAFANPLHARVIDALGGAVMGQSVTFAAPLAGATAALGTSSGSSNFNGVVSSTATANAVAGSYTVSAASGALTPNAGFSLTNDPIIGTVTWDALSFVYDGSTHGITAHITEEPATSCVVTPATVGPNVGDYAVSATCSGTTYAASGTTTASITPATATLALSNLVQVFDGTPKSATVTSTPSGVATSVTYNGNPSAPSAIGVYAVVATITDGNYTGSQVSGVLQIVEADAPDLAVSLTDGRDFVQYGKLLTYAIVVNNPGNTTISGASVTSNLPVTLLNATPSWECVQVSPGATCTPSGTGNLNETALSIPAGGGVVYLFNAWVNDDQALPTDQIETVVTVTAAGDTNPTNDSATDTTQIVIFRDGLELGGEGAEEVNSLVDPESTIALGAADVQALSLAHAWTSEGRIVELARIGNGEASHAVEVLRTSSQLLVRLVGPDQVSAWSAVAHGTGELVVGLAEGQLLLVGAATDLQLSLASSTNLRIALPRD